MSTATGGDGRCMRIRRVLLAAVTAAGLLAWSGAAPADSFFREPADLPLMPGLYELTDEALVFDYPEGRLVKVAARGIVTSAAVFDYYAATLPELGWSEVGRGRYTRDGERLSLELSRHASHVTVRFSIAPE
jgi:hypothetical protein